MQKCIRAVSCENLCDVMGNKIVSRVSILKWQIEELLILV